MHYYFWERLNTSPEWTSFNICDIYTNIYTRNSYKSFLKVYQVLNFSFKHFNLTLTYIVKHNACLQSRYRTLPLLEQSPSWIFVAGSSHARTPRVTSVIQNGGNFENESKFFNFVFKIKIGFKSFFEVFLLE